ncbi:MAG TPA: DUF3987 domain-containing protein, partial [Ktedonobacterales bacterium]|nr:DUF3987 domain-containing protein [Ktedonobacterales bacterium]
TPAPARNVARSASPSEHSLAFGRVSREQRFTRSDPCPICGGCPRDPHGQGVRCYGYLSDDGRYAHCTREEYAGALQPNGQGHYAHYLGDGKTLCRCGQIHTGAPAMPTDANSTPGAQRKQAKPPRTFASETDLPTTWGLGYTLTAVYRYSDALMVRRYERSVAGETDKKTPAYTRRADGTWIEALETDRVLYHLPAIKAAPAGTPIVFTEGEKAAEALQAEIDAAGLSWVATTTIGGAGNGYLTPLDALRGHPVVILPDCDKPGERYAATIAEQAQAAGAARVAIVRLPELRDHDDVVEWLEAGHTMAELKLLVNEAIAAYEADETLDEPPADDAEDVAPFPLVVFPTALRNLVASGAAAIHCPPDFLAVPLLVALGVAIGTTHAIEVKRGWREYARLWAAIVAKPGDKKSPALDLVMAPLHERQRRLASEYRAALAARDNASNEPPPTLQQIMTTDATIEALADLLQVNSRGVLLNRDELTGWALAMGQYKAARSADRANWLSLWNGAPIIVNRRSRGAPLFVDTPFVGVVGAIQPDVLNDLADERGREDGFIHRILFSYPQPMPRKWTDASVAPEVLAAAGAAFDRLWSMQSAPGGDGAREPSVLTFSHDAKQLWREWITGHYDEQEMPMFPDNLRGPWAKIEGYTARFALVIQLARWACGEASNDAIDATSMAAAAELADYYKSHARRVYAYLHITPDDKRALAALAWIRRQAGQCVTAREALHAHLGGVKNSDEAKQLLHELTDRGYGAVEETKATRGPNGLRFTLYQRDSRQNAAS